MFAAALAGLVLTSFAAPSLAVDRSTSPATAAELDSFVQQQRSDLGLPGVAVVVLSKNVVMFEGAYGSAGPAGRPVTINTPFALGSTSKQFTALAVQQLIVQRRVTLVDTVGALLPELSGGSSPFAGVTIAQLLSHTSGISTHEGDEEFNPWPSVTSIDDETRRVLQSQPVGPAGADFEYSNANYTILGAIIDHITGLSFEDALQTLVVVPLRLTSTTSDERVAQSRGLADGYYPWFGAFSTATPGAWWPMGAPSAFITSTATDLTRVLQAQLGASSGIDASTLEASRTPLTRVDQYSQYASGWYVRPFWELHDNDENGLDPSLPTLWEHPGSTERSMSYLAFAPSMGLGVVVLSNYALGTDQDKLSRFTTALLHKIVGTTDSPASVDALTSAAPLLMVALPIVQLLMFGWLVFALARPRPSRVGRWMPLLVGGFVTIATVFIAVVVVPGRTGASLFEPSWWNSTPDLAVSVGVVLLFAVGWVVAFAVALLKRLVRRPSGVSDAVRS
ncbi:hypothetical protein GCM10009563_20650 [Subtercola frigoramans]